jgi:hypothetical protein
VAAGEPVKHLRALYAGARALIASSLCYEALLVVLEAFQVGLPVIALKVGALSGDCGNKPRWTYFSEP